MTDINDTDSGDPDRRLPQDDEQVAIILDSQSWQRQCRFIDGVCRSAAMAALAAPAARGGRCGGTVAVVLSDDGRMRRLNRQFRQVDRPTNVLAFEACAPTTDDPVLGDVVLGFGTVLGESSRAGLRFCDHARHLVVHGCLHLLGYRHDDDADAARMEALETTVLATLDVVHPGPVNRGDSRRCRCDE